MARHTLRGLLAPLETRRLILDDGMFTEGHKIESFEVWAISLASGDDPEAFLSMSDEDPGVGFNAGDSRQIGWAMQTTTATTRLMSFATIDPDHVIIRDLFIHNNSSHPCNYLVSIMPLKLTEDQAVLQLIKETGQDV